MDTPPLLTLKQRPVVLHSALVNPDFGEPTVVASDPWKYVALFLRRKGAIQALFYWNQAQEFFTASRTLSTSASPVTSYYSALNAAKALLTYRGVFFTPLHGVSGPKDSLNDRKPPDLRDDRVVLQTDGVLPTLAEYLRPGAGRRRQSKSLYELLAAVPFIHRAFTLTFPAENELFLPLASVHFSHTPATGAVHIVCAVERKYNHLYAQLPPKWELNDQAARGNVSLRFKEGFQWLPHDLPESMKRLTTYHQRVRNRIVPIVEQVNRWYLARRESVLDALALPVVILAALHRFSELSRYYPLRLHNHLEADQNWMIDEFLEQAPAQFIHLIASEITGREFLRPNVVRLHAHRV